MAESLTNRKTKRITKRMFTVEEDALLINLVNKFGTSQWRRIAQLLPNRSTRQCRERYCHYLDPNVNNNPWTQEEEDLLLIKYNEFGPKWAIIAKYFENRTYVNVKNHHQTILQRNRSSRNEYSSNISSECHQSGYDTEDEITNAQGQERKKEEESFNILWDPQLTGFDENGRVSNSQLYDPVHKIDGE